MMTDTISAMAVVGQREIRERVRRAGLGGPVVEPCDGGFRFD
jgi:hypothetical protein